LVIQRGEIWYFSRRDTSHLPHLTLAQVSDALGYYADHQDQINQTIEMIRVPDDIVHLAVQARSNPQ
jgi:hypothetical protein